jgi:hypothetical protein
MAYQPVVELYGLGLKSTAIEVAYSIYMGELQTLTSVKWGRCYSLVTRNIYPIGPAAVHVTGYR